MFGFFLCNPDFDQGAEFFRGVANCGEGAAAWGSSMRVRSETVGERQIVNESMVWKMRPRGRLYCSANGQSRCQTAPGSDIISERFPSHSWTRFSPKWRTPAS